MNHFFKYFLLMTIIGATNFSSAEENKCKTLKSCAEWATFRTGMSYNLGKLERRSLKIEKDFNIDAGDPDLNFSYLLNQSDFARIKRDNGTYEIIAIREIKDFSFPMIKAIDLKPTLDFYSMDFNFSDKIRTKHAMTVLKKFISKNGKVLEATDVTKLTVIDSGVQLIMLQALATELNK